MQNPRCLNRSCARAAFAHRGWLSAHRHSTEAAPLRPHSAPHARGERCPHTARQPLVGDSLSEAAGGLRGPYLYPLEAAHRTQLAHAHKRAAPRTASSLRRPRQGDRAPPPPRPCLASTGALRRLIGRVTTVSSVAPRQNYCCDGSTRIARHLPGAITAGRHFNARSQRSYLSNVQIPAHTACGAPGDYFQL